MRSRNPAIPARLSELIDQLFEKSPELRPAIDLLTGGPELREALGSGDAVDAWIASWHADEEAFRSERWEILLY